MVFFLWNQESTSNLLVMREDEEITSIIGVELLLARLLNLILVKCDNANTDEVRILNVGLVVTHFHRMLMKFLPPRLRSRFESFHAGDILLNSRQARSMRITNRRVLSIDMTGASIVVMKLVLFQLSVVHRKRLLRECYNGLQDGGILILIALETAVNDELGQLMLNWWRQDYVAQQQDLFECMYYDRLSEAIEKRVDSDWNLLDSLSMFQQIDCLQQNGPFVTYVATKIVPRNNTIAELF